MLTVTYHCPTCNATRTTRVHTEPDTGTRIPEHDECPECDTPIRWEEQE